MTQQINEKSLRDAADHFLAIRHSESSLAPMVSGIGGMDHVCDSFVLAMAIGWKRSQLSHVFQPGIGNFLLATDISGQSRCFSVFDDAVIAPIAKAYNIALEIDKSGRFIAVSSKRWRGAFGVGRCPGEAMSDLAGNAMPTIRRQAYDLWL